MANTENEFSLGYVDKRRAVNEPGSASNPISAGSGQGYIATNVGALRSQLSSYNAAYFNTARLNNMTKNDMVYALRLVYDAAGI